MNNILADKVIAFCEALQNLKVQNSTKEIIDTIISSDKFKEMLDLAHDEKIFKIKNNINQ